MLANYSSFSSPTRTRLMINKHLLLMDYGGFFYVIFFLSVLSLLGISTSSSQLQCNNSTDCRINVSSLNNSSVCCRNICRSDCPLNYSSERTGNKTNRITNDTRSNATLDNLNQSLLCLKDSDCNSSKICISLACLSKSPKDKIKDCPRCESIDCKDGRCYNASGKVIPSPKTEGTITTLQLVLLFGSMGGIFIFIVVVYCVKTFTDNRHRQYLLKHGVWENPPNKDGKEKEEKEVDGKSDASRQQRKLEVPTITVETETEPKRKKKHKENLKDEVTDTDGLEEFVVEQESRNHKVIGTDRGSPILDQHVNQSTKNPYPKTKIGETIELPKNIRLPTAWDNKDESTPLTQSPKQNRFGNIKKNKENSPTKILANGTPEKSSRFGKQRQNSSVQLCEPENFSDFGM